MVPSLILPVPCHSSLGDSSNQELFINVNVYQFEKENPMKG